MSPFFHLTQSFAEVLLPIMYVMTVFLYGLAFFRNDPFAKQWKRHSLLMTSIIHFIYIGLHSMEFGRCMVTSPFEMMSLVAFTILATYTIIELATSIRGTGFFLVGIASVFQLFSAVTMKLPAIGTANPALSNLGIGLHVSAAIFGFGGIAISAVYGLLYLLMYRALKRSSFGSIYNHLPSLESLEKLCAASAAIGFLFITIAFGIGVVWLPRIFPAHSYFDPKLIATGVVWIIYAIVLIAKYVAKLDGKRVITISLGGFLLAVFSMTIVNAFFSNFHKFY